MSDPKAATKTDPNTTDAKVDPKADAKADPKKVDPKAKDKKDEPEPLPVMPIPDDILTFEDKILRK